MWIKEIVENIVNKYGTNNPYEIAEAKHIFVFESDLHEEILGFYKYIRRNKFICLNSGLSEAKKRFTIAHELGHSEMHPRVSTPFLKRKTLFSVDKLENEANRFAVELLLQDSTIYELRDDNLTIYEIAEMHGIPKELCHLKKTDSFKK